MASEFKVFIADDEELLRTGLTLVINSEQDMKVVGTAENGQIALEKIEQLQPDIVLMDIKMPLMDGIEATRKMRERFPDIPVFILTTFNEEEYIIEGLANGAKGYLLKGINFGELVQNIREAMEGKYILPSEVAAKLSRYLLTQREHRSSESSLATEKLGKLFSAREQQIIRLLLKRYSNREIAETLFISEGTVKNYLTGIYREIHVHSRREAIRYLQEYLKKS